jgi:hypothetical protein
MDSKTFFTFQTPKIITFTFISNKHYIHLSFPSSIKMSEFIQDVIEKIKFAFRIPPNNHIEIIQVEKNNSKTILELSNCDISLSEYFNSNHKNITFYIHDYIKN